MRNTVKLLLLYSVALIPILVLRDYTPSNELRYLSIADEALANGSIFTFSNQGLPYADKPPLYLWIVMLGKLIFGSHQMWFLSLFSLIPSLVVLAVMDKWMAPHLTESSRKTALLMLMTCALYLGLTAILRMDMLMIMFIVLSLDTFYKMYEGKANRYDRFLFPLYVFLAIFSKGPVGFIMPFVSVVCFLAWKRQLKTLGRYWGWTTFGILLVGCGLWFGAAYLEGGSEYLNNLLVHQTVDRAVNAFRHDKPFYYYLGVIWYSMLPWAFFVIFTIVISAFKRQINTDLERFFVVIIVSTIFVLSCFSSKIGIYLAPTFPFFIYLSLLLLEKMEIANDRKTRRLISMFLAIPAVIYVLALPGLIIAAQMPDLNYIGQPMFYVAAGIAFISGIYALYILYRKKELLCSIRIMSYGLLCVMFFGGMAIPGINDQLGYRAVCSKSLDIAEVEASNGTPTLGFCSYGIRRSENMDVFLGQDVEKLGIENLLSGEYEGYLLFMKNGQLEKDGVFAKYVNGMNQYVVGNHTIILLRH